MGELLLRIFLRGIGDVAEVRGPKLAARSSAVHLLELAGTVMPLLRDVIVLSGAVGVAVQVEKPT